MSEKSLKLERPAKPIWEAPPSHEKSVAQTVDNLSDEMKVLMLSNIDRRDIPRCSFLICIGREMAEENEPFLRDYIYAELGLTNSIKGFRSEQLVKLAKSPDFLTNERESLMDRIKGRFRR